MIKKRFSIDFFNGIRFWIIEIKNPTWLAGFFLYMSVIKIFSFEIII